MYGGGEMDGGGSASLFGGGGFMPSQATQTHDSSSTNKSRRFEGILPLTVKQIYDACETNDDKSNIVVDGVDAANVRLMGRVMSMRQNITDVTFTVDDGTGTIQVQRWGPEASDTSEMELIEDGMYVSVSGKLKAFQGKNHVVAFSVRRITDFNLITLHYLECIYVHLENTKPKVPGNSALGAQSPASNGAKGYHTPVSNQVSSFPSMPGTRNTEIDTLQLVFDIFQEPASLACENGLHIDEVARRLGLPMPKLMEAIEYQVGQGNIYSTIDEFHFKSAVNG